MTIFLIIFTLLFVIFAYYRPKLAVLLTIIALPSYLIRFKVAGLPTTLLEAMIAINFCVWFFQNAVPNLSTWIKNKAKRNAYPFSIEIILILIISFISVLIAGFQTNALGLWKAYFIDPILFFIVICNYFQTKLELNKIYWSLLISSALVALFAIFQKITGLFIDNPFWANEATRRVVSFFGFPNAVGLFLAPLSLLFIGWLFSNLENKKSWLTLKNIIITLIIIMSWLAIYFAKSEGALIAVTASVFIFLFLSGYKQKIITGILSIIILIVLIFSGSIRSFFIEKITLNDLSGQIRKQQWIETITMLRDGRFISGAGLSQYPLVIKPYHQEGIFYNSDNLPNFDSQVYGSSTLRTKYWQPVEIYLYPHNIILNFWTELGLVGVLVFAWLMGKYFYLLRKLIKNFRSSKEKYLYIGLFCSMTAIIIHGLVDVPYFKNDLSVVFWLLLAIVGILEINFKLNLEKK